ncbi:hypothetical protein BTO32_17510 [Marinobacter lutaoensis]|uniref:Uncharacterized protein n=1 Tax=Marinobacter lutaoensis TaxID=135739 RepID=A0A1V2DNB7_9GAMM|nr:hypothetical protein BTO32_17510 [Marinobacter lutaoensis]
MGYVGFEAVAGDKAGAERDTFIEKALNSEAWSVVDQSKWLFSHSGMKIPSETLFEEVFKREIMQNRLLKKSGFGRY